MPMADTGRPPLLGAVICGGASSRMGRDKALLLWRGRALLDHAVAALTPWCEQVLLCSGDRVRYPERGLVCALDPVGGAGPLAGLCAALLAARERPVLVLACDMPRVSQALLSGLLTAFFRQPQDACLCVSQGGLEPLCAVYAPSCLPAVQRSLERGPARMSDFHAGLAIGRFDPGPAAWGELASLNTPEALGNEHCGGSVL